MELAEGRSKLEQRLRDKSVTMSDLTLNQALQLIKDPNDKGEVGDLGKYEKAKATLIKKLQRLSPEDVEEAATRTIAELQEAVAAVKKPVSKAA